MLLLQLSGDSIPTLRNRYHLCSWINEHLLSCLFCAFARNECPTFHRGPNWCDVVEELKLFHYCALIFPLLRPFPWLAITLFACKLPYNFIMPTCEHAYDPCEAIAALEPCNAITMPVALERYETIATPRPYAAITMQPH